MRSGAWLKMRVNQGQEFVIGGYTPSPKNFDALVIGYYDGTKLIYAARTRNGFTPASHVQFYKRLKPLEISECPFTNLPEKKVGRWGAGLTAAKMEECLWLKPSLVGCGNKIRVQPEADGPCAVGNGLAETIWVRYFLAIRLD